MDQPVNQDQPLQPSDQPTAAPGSQFSQSTYPSPFSREEQPPAPQQTPTYPQPPTSAYQPPQAPAMGTQSADEAPQQEDLPPLNPETEQVWHEQFQKPLAEELVLQWQAANRPFKRRNRQYYTTILLLVALVSAILFFAGQFLPIAVVLSVGFMSYVLAAVPPGESIYRITTYGVRIENNLYPWETLGRFWFEQRFNQDMVHIETLQFPHRVTLMLGTTSKDDIREILSEVLLEQKPEPTAFDKAAQWLQEKIPLDIDA